MIYYNKETRPNVGGTLLLGVKELLPGSHWYQHGKRKACKSREDAIAQDISGAVYFWEDGRLYEALSRGSWEFAPLEKEPSVITGINWNDAYFFTRESAEEYFSQFVGRWDRPVYEEQYDVWYVHYHIGLTRKETQPSDTTSAGIKKMSLH